MENALVTDLGSHPRSGHIHSNRKILFIPLCPVYNAHRTGHPRNGSTEKINEPNQRIQRKNVPRRLIDRIGSSRNNNNILLHITHTVHRTHPRYNILHLTGCSPPAPHGHTRSSLLRQSIKRKPGKIKTRERHWGQSPCLGNNQKTPMFTKNTGVFIFRNSLNP